MEATPSPPAIRLDKQSPYLRLLCINIFVRDQDESMRFSSTRSAAILEEVQQFSAGKQQVDITLIVAKCRRSAEHDLSFSSSRSECRFRCFEFDPPESLP
jgi:hypothetical protein